MLWSQTGQATPLPQVYFLIPRRTECQGQNDLYASLSSEGVIRYETVLKLLNLLTRSVSIPLAEEEKSEQSSPTQVKEAKVGYRRKDEYKEEELRFFFQIIKGKSETQERLFTQPCAFSTL